MVIKIMVVLLLLTVGDNGATLAITPKEEEHPLEALKRPITPELEPITTKDMPVCNVNSRFASYMSYKAITNQSSKQYELQQIASTNIKGYRELEDRVMIAMHSQYGSVGDKLVITFNDGSTVNVILGDIKANTDCSHYVNENESSIIEVIVDVSIITDKHLGKIAEYSKPIIKIEKEL